MERNELTDDIRHRYQSAEDLMVNEIGLNKEDYAALKDKYLI